MERMYRERAQKETRLTAVAAPTTMDLVMENEKGPRIYFLHPQPVIQDDIVRVLVGKDYEAYWVRNPTCAKLLPKLSDSCPLGGAEC